MRKVKGRQQWSLVVTVQAQGHEEDWVLSEFSITEIGSHAEESLSTSAELYPTISGVDT